VDNKSAKKGVKKGHFWGSFSEHDQSWKGKWQKMVKKWQKSDKKSHFWTKKITFSKKNTKSIDNVFIEIDFLEKRVIFERVTKITIKKDGRFSKAIAPVTFKKVKKTQKWRFLFLRKAKKTGVFQFQNEKGHFWGPKTVNTTFQGVKIPWPILKGKMTKNGQKMAKKVIKKGVKNGLFWRFFQTPKITYFSEVVISLR